jgi:hypothetical protein
MKLGVDTGCVPFFPKLGQTFVLEGLDHGKNVSLLLTNVNI